MKLNRVIQIGAGGIGQFFTPVAAKIWTYSAHPEGQEFLVIDGDKYELKNADRQNGTLGRAKVEDLTDHIDECTPYAEYIEDDEDFATILLRGSESQTPGTMTVVAICVDNDITRKFIYRGIMATNVPTIVIDMANDEHHGDVICLGWQGTTRGWAPNDPFEAFPQLVKPKDRPPQAYCEIEAPHSPQLITTNMQAAAIGARMFYNILHDERLPFQVNFDHRKFAMRDMDA